MGVAETEVDRGLVLRSSLQYYDRRAYYLDLLSQRERADKETLPELRFIESAFRKYSTRRVHRVLDVACGGGRHIVGLAQKGYRCTGQDFSPGRVKMAENRATRLGVSVELGRGDATKLGYEKEFDAVLALNVLFLLPNDEDAAKCLTGAHRALLPGGVLVCNIYNAFALGKSYTRMLINSDYRVNKRRGRGIRITRIEKLKDYDPVLGHAWVYATDIIEAPDGPHVFHDRERFRFFTYWDMMRLLGDSGFKDPRCYSDWKTKPVKKPRAEQLVFLARK